MSRFTKDGYEGYTQAELDKFNDMFDVYILENNVDEEDEDSMTWHTENFFNTVMIYGDAELHNVLNEQERELAEIDLDN